MQNHFVKDHLGNTSAVIEPDFNTGGSLKTMPIDYAPKTVEFVNKKFPFLDIRLGDVTKLDFDDNFFDAYWSFGVIEHFYQHGFSRE